MRDSTTVTRLERALASLEFQLVELRNLSGRLERLATLLEENLPPTATSTPPLDPEAEELADKVIRNQLEEQRESSS